MVNYAIDLHSEICISHLVPSIVNRLYLLFSFQLIEFEESHPTAHDNSKGSEKKSSDRVSWLNAVKSHL